MARLKIFYILLRFFLDILRQFYGMLRFYGVLRNFTEFYNRKMGLPLMGYISLT